MPRADPVPERPAAGPPLSTVVRMREYPAAPWGACEYAVRSVLGGTCCCATPSAVSSFFALSSGRPRLSTNATHAPGAKSARSATVSACAVPYPPSYIPSPQASTNTRTHSALLECSQYTAGVLKGATAMCGVMSISTIVAMCS